MVNAENIRERSAAADGNDTFDLALLSSIPTTTTGLTVGDADDPRDFYRFTANLTGALNVQAFPSSSGGLDLYAYDSNRTLISSVTNSGSFPTLNIPAIHGRTYFVEVRPRTPGQTTTYSLFASSTSRSTDGNETFDTASQFSVLNNNLTANAEVGGSDLVDFLRFTASATGTLNLQLNRLIWNAELSLYDEGRNLISTSDAPGAASENIVAQVTSGRTYFVRVRSLDGAATSYSLEGSVSTDPNILNNDSFDKATTHQFIGTTVDSLGGLDRIDFFSTRPYASGEVHTQIHSTGDILFKVYDASRNLVGSTFWTRDQTGEFRFFVRGDQSYTFAVEPVGPGTVNYSVYTSFLPYSPTTPNRPIDQIRGDGNNSYLDATPINGPFSITGSVDGIRDSIDAYRIESGPGGSATFRLSEFAGPLGIALLRGTSVVAFGSAGTSSRSITVNLEPRTTYTIQVEAPAASVSSSYRLEHTYTPALRPGGRTSPDVDDTFQSLTFSSGDVGGTDLVDVFRYVAPVTGKIAFELSGLTGNADLAVLDSGQRLLAGSSNPGTSRDIARVDAIAGETYFVRVSTSDPSRVDYFIRASAPSGNDTFETARLVPAHFRADGFTGLGDPDKFITFVAPADGTMRVEIFSSLGDPNLSAYSADRTPIGFSDNPALYSEIVSFDVSAGARYFVKIGMPSNTPFQAYYSRGTFAGVSPDGNDTLDSAAVMPLGAAVIGKVGGADPEDYFKITFADSGIATIDLSGITHGADLRIYDAQRRLLAQSTASGNADEKLTLAVASNQTVFVRIDGQIYGSYSVRATAAPQPDVSADPGGDITTAAIAVLGQSISGVISDGTDTDWYKIIVPVGSRFYLDAVGEAQLGFPDDFAPAGIFSPTLTVRAADGAVLSAASSSAGKSLREVLSTGTYFVEIKGFGSNGPYRLSVGSTSADGPVDVPGDRTSAFAVAGGTTVSSDLERAGDTDWYRITVVAGDRLVVRARGSESEAGSLTDPDIVVRRLDGSVVTRVDGDPGKDTSVTLSDSGAYWIEVSSGSGATGSYRLDATLDPAAEIAGNTGSTATVTASSAVISNIGSATDTDWVKVTVASGQTAMIRLEGNHTGAGTLLDPMLVLRSSSGAELDRAIINVGVGAEIPILASGTYWAEVKSQSAQVGTYKLTMVVGGSGLPAQASAEEIVDFDTAAAPQFRPDSSFGYALTDADLMDSTAHALFNTATIL